MNAQVDKIAGKEFENEWKKELKDKLQAQCLKNRIINKYE